MVLKVENLTKIYKKKKIISDVSFSVSQGQIFGILGKKYSGKTTILNIITGLVKQDAGKYWWFDDTSLNHNIRKMGIMVASPGFYPYLSLEKNLAIIASIKGEDFEELERTLFITNLTGLRKLNFKALPESSKRRASLASALLGDPEILILDEPSAGMDINSFIETRQILRQEIKKGKTIIITSENPEEIEKLCSLAVLIEHGKIYASGKVTDLIHSENQVTISTERVSELYNLLLSSGLTKKIQQSDYDINITLKDNITPADLNGYAFKNGFILSKLEFKKAGLEILAEKLSEQ
ncbi:MAG: ABC transporter ATP-binding protein [Bacteroidia bacterium]|nr:ABC transporter ATP-binding protein [Bacteroidia bacterium]